MMRFTGLPVSTMWQWCVSRSSNTVMILAASALKPLKGPHFESGRCLLERGRFSIKRRSIDNRNFVGFIKVFMRLTTVNSFLSANPLELR